MTAMRTNTKKNDFIHQGEVETLTGRKCIFKKKNTNSFCRAITSVTEQLEFTENSHPPSISQLLLQLGLGHAASSEQTTMSGSDMCHFRFKAVKNMCTSSISLFHLCRILRDFAFQIVQLRLWGLCQLWPLN